MARTISADANAVSDSRVEFYKHGDGQFRMRVTMTSTDGSVVLSYEEVLADALTALVGAGTITAAQRTAFTAVASALRTRARDGLNLNP